MKFIVSFCSLILMMQMPRAINSSPVVKPLSDTSSNIFIITVDGFRWQELFNGADSDIINNTDFTADSQTINSMYWAPTAAERRKKLMPFMWSVVANKGVLYGNRAYDNNVNVANLYDVSYPGYSEMFTGKTDITIASNSKTNNRNINIFEYLNSKENYKGKIALFTSWDVFPFILNEKRSGIDINSGYTNVKEENNYAQKALNIIQADVIEHKDRTRQDMLTYIAAKEYLQQHHPKVFYLGLGETDEYAHHRNYDMYLQKANETDQIISQLWHWAQTTEGYKDNTTFIITTDHGRGENSSRWISHGPFIKGSSQTWLALIGKHINPIGEMKTQNQIYQKQLAQTIAYLLGEEFGNQKPMLSSIAVN